VRFYFIVIIVLLPFLLQANSEKKLIFEINGELKSSKLYDALGIETRPWYKFWKDKNPDINIKIIPTISESLDYFYKSEGFYNSTIKKIETNESVIFKIDEGLPILIKDISIHSDENIDKIITFKKSKRFRTKEFSEIKKEIKNLMLEEGYCNYQLDAKARVDIEKDIVSLDYKLKRNNPCYFGKIMVDTPQNIKKKIIFSRLNFEQGDRYSLKNVNRSYSTISGLEAFDGINIDLDKKEDLVDVKIHLKEKEKKTRIELGVGYETNIGPRGIFRWERRNFAGNARKIAMDFKYSQKEKYATNTIYWPAFVKLPFKGHYYLDLKNTLSYSKFEFLNFVERKYSNYLHLLKDYDVISVDFGVGLERINIEKLKNVDNFQDGDFNLLFPFGKISLDLRDSKINPKNGIYLSQYIETGIDLLKDSSTYLKSITEGRAIYTLGLYTFAAKGKIGLIQEYANRLPASKLFFAGGSFSNRGYGYNTLGAFDAKYPQTGGETLIDTTLEMSHQLYKKFDGALFWDSTLLSKDSHRFSIDFVHSVGIGVRYISPIGPVKLDLAMDVNNHSQYALHFQIGQSF